MGMFDYVRCELEMPEGFPVDVDPKDEPNYQTKDLDNCLHVYTVTKEGILIKQRFVGDEEDNPTLSDAKELVELTGELRFYGYPQQVVAQFSNGRLKTAVFMNGDEVVGEWPRNW